MHYRRFDGAKGGYRTGKRSAMLISGFRSTSAFGSIKSMGVHLAIALWLRPAKITRSQTHVLRRNHVDAQEYRHLGSESS